MLKVKCVGHNFAHSTSSTLSKVPKHIVWDFDTSYMHSNDITFFIDNEIIDAHLKYPHLKKTYGWLLESRCLNYRAMDWVAQNLEICKKFFSKIFTFDKALLELDSIFHFLPAYGTYIDCFQSHHKTKLVSMVTSNKNFAPLHGYRNQFALLNKDKLDLYGRGYNEIDKKEKGLNDYMFSVAIENDLYNYYYTEKLIDCFATKTIPIYLGSPIITPFKEEGVIRLTTNFDFSLLSEEVYKTYLPHVEENFEIAKSFDCLDDYLFEKYFDFESIML